MFVDMAVKYALKERILHFRKVLRLIFYEVIYCFALLVGILVIARSLVLYASLT